MAKSVKIIAGSEATIVEPAFPTQHVWQDIKENLPLCFPNLILPDVNHRITYTLNDSEINIAKESQFQGAFAHFPSQLTLTVHTPSPSTLKDIMDNFNEIAARLSDIEKKLDS